MSTFKVSLERIATSVPHSNADRLSICTLEGMSFQFVTMRDQFKPKDLVLYYPVDSNLSQDRIAALGLIGKLAGKDKNRIKTVRLRDAISQGIVELAYNWSGIDPTNALDMQIGTDFTEALGVTKWEPDEVAVKNAILVPIGTIGLSVYDIEGADRYPQIVELLLDLPCNISEKLEGQNLSVTATPNECTFVGSRNNLIIEDEGKQHPLCKVAREQGLLETAEFLSKKFNNKVTIYGEYLGPGVQGNIYKLEKNEIRCFDVKVGGDFLDVDEAKRYIISQTTKWVPTIVSNVTLREALGGKSLQENSNGPSYLDSTIKREGLVIKPMKEKRIQGLGRLILKQRSPEYLDKSEL